MKQAFYNFIEIEDGAAVVEMTILMAAFCGLALAVMTQVGGGMDVLTTEMEETIIAQDAEAAW